jgi:hypothetical protein
LSGLAEAATGHRPIRQLAIVKVSAFLMAVPFANWDAANYVAPVPFVKAVGGVR